MADPLDHAPHLAEEKEREFVYAPFGIIGLECALPLYIQALVEPGHIGWMQLVDMMTSRCAKIVQIDKGTLRQGKDADVTIIDPNLKWTIDVSTFQGKSRNCPFDGWDVKGRAVTTIVGGQVKWSLEEQTIASR